MVVPRFDMRTALKGNNILQMDRYTCQQHGYGIWVYLFSPLHSSGVLRVQVSAALPAGHPVLWRGGEADGECLWVAGSQNIQGAPRPFQEAPARRQAAWEDPHSLTRTEIRPTPYHHPHLKPLTTPFHHVLCRRLGLLFWVLFLCTQKHLFICITETWIYLLECTYYFFIWDGSGCFVVKCWCLKGTFLFKLQKTKWLLCGVQKHLRGQLFLPGTNTIIFFLSEWKIKQSSFWYSLYLMRLFCMCCQLCLLFIVDYWNGQDGARWKLVGSQMCRKHCFNSQENAAPVTESCPVVDLFSYCLPMFCCIRTVPGRHMTWGLVV